MKKVTKTTLDGTFDAEWKFKARSKFEQLIEDQLREEGRVPVIDKDTEWSIHWNETADTYDFVISMYSVHVGTKKAKTILGYSSEKEELIYV